MRPHIIHIVGHTEADHAATADDVIESCKLARRAIENALRGAPDMTSDPAVQQRKTQLVNEAKILLGAIRSIADDSVTDPLSDATTLARAVATGLLDAPQLRNNQFALGSIVSKIDERGACVTVNPNQGRVVSERERV